MDREIEEEAQADAKPTLGARSRQFLQDRTEQYAAGDMPVNRPIYSVPAYEAKTKKLTLPGVIIGLHLLFGVACGIIGALIIMGFASSAEGDINAAGVIGGIAMMGYGGFCILLSLALGAGTPWAWNTSLALAVFWAIFLAYLGLVHYPIVLALLIWPAVTIAALLRQKHMINQVRF